MLVPREEILNPQTTLMLDNIDSRLPAEEFGVLTESGRINKQGRKIADDVYQEFLSRSNGDFKRVLELCKEAESVLYTNDPDSRDNETVKIIQSVRGKVVYNAHRTWVEKQMNLDAYGMGDLSATNVMRYAHILRSDQKIDVYEEATNIERERAEINEQLKLASEKLQKENDAILEADIESVTEELPPIERKSILREIKTKLGNFTQKALESKTRRKIVAGALSALAVAGIALGYVANLRNSKSSNKAVLQALNKPQVAQVEKLPEVIAVETETIIGGDYIESSNEIPEDNIAKTNIADSQIMDATPEPENNINIEQPIPTPTMELTTQWDEGVNTLELVDGRGKISLSLFLEKDTDFNYWKGAAPDGNSVLIWNATEAAMRFKTVELKPGDNMSFTQHIGFGDIISKTDLQNENIRHGDGYITNGEGACFTASVFGEALGTFIADSEGNRIPLFKADVGAIQGHGKDAYDYYQYLYHGPGVGINSSEYGQLKFSVNPDLPESLVVKISMGIMDTNPEDPENGTFSPVVTIEVQGIPEDWKSMENLRLTANRHAVLEAVTGRAW